MGPAEWAMLAALSVLWGGSFMFNGLLVAEGLPPLTVVLVFELLSPLGSSICWRSTTMFDSARRSTMQPPSDLNARSHLPVPSTVKKPTHTGRMSLAGPALRGPYPMPGQIPGTNPRQSMMRSQNVNPLLQSASKPNFGRTPLHR